MKACTKHKDAVVAHLGVFNRDSCPICRAMRRIEDESAKAIDESEEQIRKLEAIIGAKEEQIRSLNKRLGDAENDVALCQCWECALLRAIDSLSTCSPSIECCQKSEKT